MVGAVRARGNAGAGDRASCAKRRASPPPIRRFVGALATVETPVQYLDAPEMRRFWDADAKKLAEAVERVGKLE